jgi:hypothetical protein
MTRIGLLGATGRVGIAVLRHLDRDPAVQVLAAGRSRARTEAAIASLAAGRVDVDEFDLLDAAHLERFCGSVDLVINCAGPSGVVLDRVILAAARAGRPVIDPGGYDPVLKRLKAIGENRKSDCAPIIVGAGLLPGLSGLYPRWVADCDMPPDRLDVFYAGTDAWGPSSAWDIIQSVGDFGAERPPSFYRGGKPLAVPFRRAFRTMNLPPPVGQVRGFLVYTEELARLADAVGISEVHCHGTNNGRWSGLILGLVKLARLHRTTAQIERSARWLSWASHKDRRNGQAPCFAIDCAATWRDGRRRQARIVVGDTYEATAAVLVSLVRLLIDGNLRARPGGPAIGMMHELFEAEPFLRAFRATGCVLAEEMLAC